MPRLRKGRFRMLLWRQIVRTNIIAGTDTTASTATFAVWYLSQNPEIEQALIREVSALPATFDNEKLRDLKVLDNVIRETLRVRPSVGQGLPRAVTPGGVHSKAITSRAERPLPYQRTLCIGSGLSGASLESSTLKSSTLKSSIHLDGRM